MSLRRVFASLGFGLVGLVGCAEAGSEDPQEQTTQALQTFPNEQAAFAFFVSKGLTDNQIGGIIGNLDAESGLDPTIHQGGGGPGRGIAQWSAGARWDTTSGDNVMDYAADQGESALTLQLQLEFIWFELTNFSGYGLAQLQATSTVSEAVSVFKAKYEGCAGCATGNRVAFGQSAVDRFGDGNSGGTSSSSSSSGEPDGPECTIDNGDVGVCIGTDACDALGDHLSSPGFCPGSSDIQCCTPVAGASSSGGTTGGGSSSSGSKPKTDAGTSGAAGDDDADPLHPEEPDFEDPGCAAGGPARGIGALWMVGLGLLIARRRARAA